MAGEVTGYYIYEDHGVNRRLKGMHGSQAQADAAAILDGAATAFQGSTEFPNDIAIGWIYDTVKSEWRDEITSDLSELNQLRVAARRAHDALIDWEAQADVIGHFKPSAVRAIVHDFLVWTHAGLAKVCLSTQWSIADRIKVCDDTSTGPLDVTDIYSFYDVADGITSPTGPVLFARPDTLVRIDLDECITQSAVTDITDYWAATPDADDLLHARWTNGITA